MRARSPYRAPKIPIAIRTENSEIRVDGIEGVAAGHRGDQGSDAEDVVQRLGLPLHPVRVRGLGPKRAPELGLTP